MFTPPIQTLLFLFFLLNLLTASAVDPLAPFPSTTSERRHLVDTCPENYTNVEPRYNRVKFKPSQTNICIKDSDLQIGERSGDWYFGGYCHLDGKYFVARYGIKFYKPKWGMRSEYSATKLYVDNQETKVYNFLTIASRFSLHEYDANSGEFLKYFNIMAHFSTCYGCYDMAFDDNGAVLFISEIGNNNPNSGVIYKFNVTSGTLEKYDGLSTYSILTMKSSYSTSKIILNDYSGSSIHLSVVNLAPVPSLVNIYAYKISDCFFYYPTQNFGTRSDPRTSSLIYNLYVPFWKGIATDIFILTRTSLLEPSSSQISISKYIYRNCGYYFYFYDFTVMNNSIYFLFYNTGEDCKSRVSRILFIMENVGEGPLPSIHECVANYKQGNCKKAFITTPELQGKVELPKRILHNNQLIILYSDLDSILEGSDFEFIEDLSKYFTGLASLSLEPTTIPGNTISRTVLTVSQEQNLAPTNDAEVELDPEGSYINYYIQQVSKIVIKFTQGEVETFETKPGCSINGELNLKYSLDNLSDERLNDLLTVNETTGAVSVNATGPELSSKNYTANLKIESSSIKGPVYIPMEIIGVETPAEEEEEEPTNNETSGLAGVVGPSLAASFVGVSAVVGSISLATPNSGPGGLWMIINQQQLLVLLMMIESHIHSDIKFFITRTKYVTFSFKELHLRSLDFTTLSNQFDKMYRNQTREGLRDLGYGSISAAQSNIEIPIAFILISIMQLICIITCIIIRKVDWGKYKKRPEATQNTNNNNNDCPEEAFGERVQNIDSGKNIDEQNVIPLSFWRKLWNGIKKWTDDYLPIRLFTNVYIRICLEIFFIVSATTLNELTNPGFSNAAQTISFVFTLFMLFLCLGFIVFLFLYFYKHYLTDLSNGNNNRPKIYFGELFLDLRPGIGRIDNPMIILRKFIYLFIIFCPGLNPPAVFSILIILQVAYLVQTILVRKMSSLLLHIASIVNESFLILFMFLFVIWREKHHWNDDGGFDKKLFVIYMILLNTIVVILLQIISLIVFIKSYKAKKNKRETESNNTENPMQSEEEKSPDQSPVPLTQRNLSKNEDSNSPEIELSQSKPID